MARERKQVLRSAADFFPDRITLATLRAAARGCRGCDLYQRATQTVFGEGPARARVMLVGEKPGDREDLEGRPFVGPAGLLLDRALEAAGISRKEVYVTNLVKHFKWEERGKRRLHKKPNQAEIRACRPWLEQEIAVVRPLVLVCLGATAAHALIGRGYSVRAQRGEWVASPLARYVTVTVHPSSILRQRDDISRRRERDRFIDDLRKVTEVLGREARREAA
ncbi:MAG TPA: UdgX family uracil-DNA binding protein [Longimicrobiales bacterium]|nr:UdgX family uracil-DNA binding protein [Longimicrobiales bacterium]